VATRRIVGWSIAKHQTQRLVQEAIVMAIGRNPNRPNGAVYHSDRGCQYTAKKTKQLVEQNGFRKSMSRPGTPSVNQPIVSFGKRSNVRWLISAISHSMKLQEQLLITLSSITIQTDCIQALVTVSQTIISLFYLSTNLDKFRLVDNSSIFFSIKLFPKRRHNSYSYGKVDRYSHIYQEAYKIDYHPKRFFDKSNWYQQRKR